MAVAFHGLENDTGIIQRQQRFLLQTAPRPLTAFRHKHHCKQYPKHQADEDGNGENFHAGKGEKVKQEKTPTIDSTETSEALLPLLNPEPILRNASPFAQTPIACSFSRLPQGCFMKGRAHAWETEVPRCEPARFCKAACIGKCSMPFKTSPTPQIGAFQRLQ